ncbi:transmembrane protein 215 [Pectobacterium phage POP12]|nr:transmembrane protein 215 [Pectobacterium phage POP12]
MIKNIIETIKNVSNLEDGGFLLSSSQCKEIARYVDSFEKQIKKENDQHISSLNRWKERALQAENLLTEIPGNLFIREGHNFSKPMGYAIVLDKPGSPQHRMKDGGVHDTLKEANEILSKEYKENHTIVELVCRVIRNEQL